MPTLRLPRQAHPAAALLALALSASGCFSGASHPITPGSPVIQSFQASPTTVASGGTATLSWSVSGADTLSIAPGVGPVTGTSVQVAPTATTTYTLTATNAGGDSTSSVTVTVVQPPSGLTYAVNPAVYAVGTAITANTPSYAGGVVSSWSVSPALPAGLSLGASTGILSGTPTAVTALAVYTITGTNAAGSTSVDVTITVTAPAPPAGLAYSANPATYTVGTAITANAPSSTGGAIASYSVTPALPAGLSLNVATGVITGTPTAAAAQAVYTITGTNAAGSTTAALTLTVTASLAPPAGLTYSANPATYTVGTAITPNTPSSTGGAIASYAVSPALPAGLSIAATTGIISGTPTSAAAQATYTVTGTNASGSTTAVLTLTVTASLAPPAGLTYSANPATYTVGTAITPNTPSSTGGTIASYTVSPALPAGLSIATATGVITGIPTSATAQADYVITGTNASGSTTAGLTLTVTVVPGPPAGLAYSANPASYTVNTAIAANVPSSTGGTITSYAVSPPLPAGLALDPVTGVVSGTPTAETALAVYTVTGTNANGSTPVGLSITVSASPTPSGFSFTGSMSSPREYHTATLLRDGRVLVAGGFDGSAPVRTAEIYDPTAGTFSATGSMTTARQNHCASLLPDGRVLVTGGLVNNNLAATAAAEIFDPAAGTFSPASNDMPDARFDFTSTTLQSGKVLVAGGLQRVPARVYLATAALFDPATNLFTPTGTLRVARAGPVAVLLDGGKVLVAGGSDAVGSYLASADLYDSTAGTFSATGAMPGRRVGDTATALQTSGSPPAATGLVLVAGGFDGTYVAASSVYDPTGGTFTATGALQGQRGFQTAALLPDGTVLIAGGTNGAVVLATAEIYDPVSGTFAPASQDMGSRRWHHTATRLQDGRVLIVGGSSGAGTLTSAELWTP